MARGVRAEITVDGMPLKEWLKDNDQEFKLEVTSVRIETVAKIAKAIHHNNAPKSPRSGTGSGRGRGNPGTKRGRSLSPAEVEEENRKRGLLQFPERKTAT